MPTSPCIAVAPTLPPMLQATCLHLHRLSPICTTYNQLIGTPCSSFPAPKLLRISSNTSPACHLYCQPTHSSMKTSTPRPSVASSCQVNLHCSLHASCSYSFLAGSKVCQFSFTAPCTYAITLGYKKVRKEAMGRFFLERGVEREKLAKSVVKKESKGKAKGRAVLLFRGREC